MALSVARLKHRSLVNPSLFHLFSTSSSNDQNDSDNNDTPQSEFQRRSSVPPPTDPNDASSHSRREEPILHRELYKRNFLAKLENAAGGTESRPSKPSANLSLDEIMERMRQYRRERMERRGELRQFEEEEAALRDSGFSFEDALDTLNKLKMTDDEKARKTSNIFTPDEDIALISSWLNTRMNPSVRADQKGQTFWSKVANNFYENVTGLSRERTVRSLVRRCVHIQHAMNEFMVFVAMVENSRPSGYNEQDKIQKAKARYLEVVGSTFKFEHCWNIWSLQSKWLETNGVDGRKKPTITYIYLS
ncbi:uncharacterized protein LOC120008104 isoform X2 [Tripterygium wilfordii]|uniref:uncharacterized protein LOC120008104 isoform X2 n=1 Tax=Tripterygium wilfordii TaxID=458696 RepID=UPI0018F7E705|nr:uncharacterized protein LOC120008104 isoform X2 [Tripterygium wilfordii]